MKYSKTKLKSKMWIKILIAIFAVILIVATCLIIYIKTTNIIVYEKIDDSAKSISEDVAKNSTPIIVNDVVVGAAYDKKFVSVEEYYKYSLKKEATEVDMYNIRGKAGTFNIHKIAKDAKSSTLYATLTSLNRSEEYLAVAKDTMDIMKLPAVETEVVDEDYDFVKALGFYKLLNTSVKINKAFAASLKPGENIRILEVSSRNNNFGVYSALISIQNGKAEIIKYNYVNDTKNSEKWSKYSFTFMADLNLDGTSEMIIKETKQFEVLYSILEYKNGKFVQVLSSSMKI